MGASKLRETNIMKEINSEMNRLENIVNSMEACQLDKSTKLVKAQMIRTYAEILQNISESLSEKADKIVRDFME